MPIDKLWNSKPQNTIEYSHGLNTFFFWIFLLNMVMVELLIVRVIKCPCSKCGFKKWQTRDVDQEHLSCRPCPKNYKTVYAW